MVKKNICQNLNCCRSHTKDRWNKKLGRYQSRKAYFPPDRSYKTYTYFCTTSCANQWLEANLENIIERKHCPNKITEKIIGQ